MCGHSKCGESSGSQCTDVAAGGSESVSAFSIGDVGLWPALNDALLMFPLTKGLRLALLNLLCSQQVRDRSIHFVCML